MQEISDLQIQFEKLVQQEEYEQADKLVQQLNNNIEFLALSRQKVLPLLYRIGYVYPDIVLSLAKQRRDIPFPFLDIIKISLNIPPSNKIYNGSDLLVSVKTALFQRKDLKAKLLLHRFFKQYKIKPIFLIKDHKMQVGNNSRAFKPYKNKEKITTIVTTYNSSEFVTNCLNSLLNQTVANHEIIVVDDASEDNTIELVTRLFPTITIISCKKNQGTYHARNIGIQHATGTYIAFQDSDDWSHPQRLEVQLEILKNDSSVFACFAKFFRVNINTGLPDCRQLYPLLRLNMSSLMMKTDDLRELNGFDDNQRVESDTKLFHKIKSLDKKIVIINKPLSIGSYRPDSLTSGSEFGFNKYGFSRYRQPLFKQD